MGSTILSNASSSINLSFKQASFGVWLPKIKSPFIPVTVGDDGVPIKALSRRSDNLIQVLSARKLDLRRVLDNPNMIAWYALNVVFYDHISQIISDIAWSL